MARTSGTYKLSSNLEMEVGAPLDARDIVLSVDDMTASGTFPYHYIGMETYVVGSNKKYRLIGSNPTVLANWEEVGTGGADFDLVEVTEAQWAELTPEQKADPTKLYFRPEANGLFRTLQDNGSATAFVPDAIPTGRTATSVINNMLVSSSDVVEGYYVDEVQFYTSDVVVILGYYDDGNFYEDSAHTVLIVGEEGPKYYDKTSDDFYAYTEGSGYAVTTAPTAVEEKSNTLYVDLTTNNMYRYDTTEEEFISTSAAGVEVQNDASATSLDASKVPTGQTIDHYLGAKIIRSISEEDYAELSNTEKMDPKVLYLRPGASTLGYPIQDNASATDLTNGSLATGQTIKSYMGTKVLKAISEADYALLSTEQKNDPGIVYFRYEADELGYDIQDNSSATSLTTDALPTGGTITSFLNSKTYPNVIISNVDLNTVKTTGTYRLNGSITNSAYGNYGVLQVYATGTTVRQVQYTENPDDIYTRVFYNNEWTTWKQMVNVDYLNNKFGTKATGSITAYNTGGTFEQFCCYKYGNVVNASARHYGISVPASGQFFTLPEGFRPSSSSYGFGSMYVNGVGMPVVCSVNTSGAVVFSYSSSQTTTQVTFSITFPFALSV